MATSKAQLFGALKQRVGFEVVSETETPNQLRILGRIPEDSLGLNGNNWKIVKYRLLTVMEQRPWKVDLSKSYFIKKETKKMVFAWRVLLQGENIAQHYADLVNIIMTSPSARVEVTEIPLGSGNEANRNSTAGGRRGAGPMGSVPTGPLAVGQKNMGG
jgi:hypothetical protein